MRKTHYEHSHIARARAHARPDVMIENEDTTFLVDEAIRRGEGKQAAHGPLVVETGRHTGRAARDKFIVVLSV